jgi:hypothetical protein
MALALERRPDLAALVLLAVPRGLVQLPVGELVRGEPDGGPVDALREETEEEFVDEILVDGVRVRGPREQELGLGLFRRRKDAIEKSRGLDHCADDLPDDGDGRDRRDRHVESHVGERQGELLGIGGLREGDLGEESCRPLRRHPCGLGEYFAQEVADDGRLGEVHEREPTPPGVRLLLAEQPLADRGKTSVVARCLCDRLIFLAELAVFRSERGPERARHAAEDLEVRIQQHVRGLSRSMFGST